MSQQFSRPNTETNASFAAPLLAAAFLLLSLTLLTTAEALKAGGWALWSIIAIAAILPAPGAILASWKGNAVLADWLWSGFVLCLLVTAHHVIPEQSLVSGAAMWGVMTAIALATAIFTGSGTSLLLTIPIMMVWCVLAYASNPPAEFLWPYLLLIALGIAWAERQQNQFAATGFALALIMWTGFTAQAAIVLRVGGLAQISLMAALFLSAVVMVIRATRKPKPIITWDELVIIMASASAAGLAFSPFATFTPNPGQTDGLLYWVLLSAILLLIVVLAVLNSNESKLDKAGLFMLAGVLILVVFAPLDPVKSWWWDGAGGGVLSIVGIWIASRGFANADPKTGFGGMAIWAVSVLLTSSGLEQQWLRVAIFALYSVTAVGFYLLAERQYRTELT